MKIVETKKMEIEGMTLNTGTSSISLGKGNMEIVPYEDGHEVMFVGNGMAVIADKT